MVLGIPFAFVGCLWALSIALEFSFNVVFAALYVPYHCAATWVHACCGNGGPDDPADPPVAEVV